MSLDGMYVVCHPSCAVSVMEKAWMVMFEEKRLKEEIMQFPVNHDQSLYFLIYKPGDFMHYLPTDISAYNFYYLHTLSSAKLCKFSEKTN